MEEEFPMIDTVDFLLKSRQDWIDESERMLAIDGEHRIMSRDELTNFLDVLLEALLTGDSNILESRIDRWLDVNAIFESVEQALSGYQARGAVSVLHVLRNAAFAVVQRKVEPEKALLYQNNLEAQFCRIIEYAAYREFAVIIEKLTTSQNEIREAFKLLEETRLSFVTVAAQELRTPLTLIEGYTEMLKEKLSNEDSESGPLVSGVESGIQKLRCIIDELVDIAMIDTEMLALQYQPVQLKELLEKARAEFEARAAERSLKLEFKSFPEAENRVYVDPERLLQAILNVLENSVIFTPSGGSITLDGRMLPGFIELTVTDTGVGISPRDQAKIFEKFGSGQRSDRGGNVGAEPGPGLGLHLTKGILEAHGGAIWVESAGYDEVLHPGSTFHLMFPYRESPPDDLAARLKEHRKGSSNE